MVTSGGVRVGVGVWIVVVLAAGVASAIVDDRGVGHPSRWDARIEPLAAFVEEERELEWAHPVHVEFLADEEFQQTLEIDEGALTDQDRADIEDGEAMLRALNLIGGDVDLVEISEQVSQAGTLAYYSTETKRVTIRGEALTPAVRETVVHELVHALQDQHFDIGFDDDSEDDGGEDGGRGDDATTFALRRVIVEGDAERVAAAYVETLTAEDQQALHADRLAEVGEAEASFGNVPAVVVESFSIPYAMGPYLVDLAHRRDGNSAVDELLQDPPSSEEQVLDPQRLFEGDEPMAVEGRVLQAAEEEVDRGTFGSIGIMMLLSGRAPPIDVFDAAVGWAGDEYVVFRREGRVCIDVQMAMDSHADLLELLPGFERWKAVASDAHLEAEDTELSFGACDPGGTAPAAPTEFPSPLAIPVIRGQLATAVLDQSGSLERAFCFADRVIHSVTYEQLTSQELDESARNLVGLAMSSCARDF